MGSRRVEMGSDGGPVPSNEYGNVPNIGVFVVDPLRGSGDLVGRVTPPFNGIHLFRKIESGFATHHSIFYVNQAVIRVVGPWTLHGQLNFEPPRTRDVVGDYDPTTGEIELFEVQDDGEI